MGLRSGKNFITTNAVEAILAVPKNRRLPPVDYLGKEDYGRVPVRRIIAPDTKVSSILFLLLNVGRGRGVSGRRTSRAT